MFQIDPVTPTHPLWPGVSALADELNQSDWFAASYDWHLSEYVLAAVKDGRVVGFLRCVVQAIGVEEDRPPMTRAGTVLREAKVLAFGVVPAERGQGIGRALQERLIADGRAAGWYQIRSFSSDAHPENHRLKLALGFGVHPLPAGKGREGVYFILPLSGEDSRSSPD